MLPMDRRDLIVQPNSKSGSVDDVDGLAGFVGAVDGLAGFVGAADGSAGFVVAADGSAGVDSAADGLAGLFKHEAVEVTRWLWTRWRVWMKYYCGLTIVG